MKMPDTDCLRGYPVTPGTDCYARDHWLTSLIAWVCSAPAHTFITGVQSIPADNLSFVGINILRCYTNNDRVQRYNRKTLWPERLAHMVPINGLPKITSLRFSAGQISGELFFIWGNKCWLINYFLSIC